MMEPSYFPSGASYLGLRIDYGLRNTDACRLYHLVAGLVEVSTCVGRQLWIPFGDRRMFLNLYLCLLGRSGRSRKSTVLGQTRTILARSGRDRILPEEWSAEGLVKALKETPEGILILPELGHALEQFQRQYAHGVREFLAEIWDCPDQYRRRLAEKTITLEDLYLCFLTASTPEGFWSRVRPMDIDMGFLSRFLFVPEEAKESEYSIPPGTRPESMNVLIKALHECTQMEGPLSLERIREGYDALYHRWMRADPQLETNPLVRNLEARLPTYILKLAGLLHVGESTDPRISPEALEKAQALTEDLRRAARGMMERYYAPTREAHRWNQVRALIGAKPGITERELSQRFHLLARDRDAFLDGMEEAGVIYREGGGKTGSPKRCYLHTVMPEE